MSKSKSVSSKGKPVVRYKPVAPGMIAVGYRATIIPLDHPDQDRVPKGEIAHTTEVVSYDPANGNFETKNSKYVLATEPEAEVPVAE